VTPEQRAARYAQMRADRLRRQGRPESDPALIVRLVLSSSRLAGIDARPWLGEK
jgi:hypothetical protein